MFQDTNAVQEIASANAVRPMYQGRSIEAVIEQVQNDNTASHDLLVPARNLRFVERLHDDGEYRFNLKMFGDADTDSYPMSSHTEKQLAKNLEIPGSFYAKLSADYRDLLNTNVNTLLRRSTQNRILRTLNGSARAYLSDRYNRIDNYDVLLNTFDAVQGLSGVGHKYEVASCEVSDHSLYLKILFPRVTGNVAVGDAVQAGVMIRNSEIGSGSTSVRGFVMRLVCNNGLVVPVSTMQPMVKRHTGPKHELPGLGFREVFSEKTIAAESKALLMKMKDVIAYHADQDNFDRLVEIMQGSTKDRITGQPRSVVEALGYQLTMTQFEREIVLSRLLQSGDQTRWGLVNAVTEASKSASGYERATALEEMGGKVLTMPSSNWQKIAEAVPLAARVA